jgi:hypothetical protein
MLYRPELDGIDQDPKFAPMGIGSLSLGDWFQPFRDDQLDPYRGGSAWSQDG